MTAATHEATIAEFWSAERKLSDANTSRYQRSEKPVNGNDSPPVLWNENSTIRISGTNRKTSARIVTTALTGLR